MFDKEVVNCGSGMLSVVCGVFWVALLVSLWALIFVVDVGLLLARSCEVGSCMSCMGCAVVGLAGVGWLWCWR